MARPLRIEFPNAYYHVTNRGNEGVRVFPSDRYYRAFLDGVAEACSRFNVEVHAYCLLGNEYHLLLKTPEGNLSRFMRQVDGLYTQHYQRMKKSTGSVFRARYKSVLVQQERYLLRLSRYIHCLAPPSKGQAKDYAWSSLVFYANREKPPRWLERREVLTQLNGGARPYARYLDYVSEGPDDELRHFYARRNLQSVLGDEKFRQKMKRKSSPDTPRGVSRGAEARRRPGIREVVAVVAKQFKVSEESIYRAARGPGSKNVPRWVAMYLCQEVSAVTLQTIAQRFGLKRYGTVSTTIGKLKQEMREDARMASSVEKLNKKLHPA